MSEYERSAPSDLGSKASSSLTSTCHIRVRVRVGRGVGVEQLDEHLWEREVWNRGEVWDREEVWNRGEVWNREQLDEHLEVLEVGVE